MSKPSEEQERLWKVIVSYGLQEEYERDWLGRIKSRRTKRYLRAEITPELAQFLAGTGAQLGGAVGDARAALTAAPESVRRLLSNLQQTKAAD